MLPSASKSQDEDLQQPIRSIMEQQPADDGWCVFGGLGAASNRLHIPKTHAKKASSSFMVNP